MAEHPLPWRVGTKGKQTLYDASPVGDGGQPGRSIGRMDTPELAARVVEAVNGLAELEAEVRDLRRRRLMSYHPVHHPRIDALLREEPPMS